MAKDNDDHLGGTVKPSGGNLVGDQASDQGRAALAEALNAAVAAGQWSIASRILARLEALDGAPAGGTVVDLDKRRR